MELSDNVTVIEREGRTWYLLGTAHVSQQSVDEVRALIEQVQPDTVCIELCETRYQALTDENRWAKLDLFEVIKQGKTLMLLANLAIGAYQRRLGAQLGVKPGAEMMEAAKLATEHGAEIALVDRDIQTTLKRTWANVGLLKRLGLMSALMESMIPGGKQDVSAEEIEKLKDSSNLSKIMDEFAEALPEVKGPLIDERDRYMIAKLRAAPGDRLVAVVGAGHVPGMVAHFDAPVDLEELERLPKPTGLKTVLQWLVPVLILAAFWYGYQKGGNQLVGDMAYAWFLPNVLIAAMTTAMAGAKPLSVLIAAIGSPFTSLNPLVPLGVPVGYVEAKLRKPTVQDAERIPDDVQSLRGVYRNPFTRVLLVVVLSLFGSALGAWIAGGWIAVLVARAGGA